MKIEISRSLGNMVEELTESWIPDLSMHFRDKSPRENLFHICSEISYNGVVDTKIMEEPSKQWILNLSMHFQDKSSREKFFLTYAEAPDR